MFLDTQPFGVPQKTVAPVVNHHISYIPPKHHHNLHRKPHRTLRRTTDIFLSHLGFI